MASGQPYDELGRILAEGGDIALGVAISHGSSPARIALIVRRHMANATEAEIAAVTRLANQGVDAARKLQDMPGSETINPADIPVNTLLFGDTPDGRRALVSVDFSVNDTDRWYRIDIGVVDISNQDAMLESAREEAERRLTDSPKGFNVGSIDDVQEFNFRFNYVVRRF